MNKTLTKPLLFKNLMHRDKRGLFFENFKKKKIKMNFAFSAAAYSKKNVIRGLHFQLKKKQTKFITLISGEIIDICVNLKKTSKNFGKIYYFKMKEGDSLLVPNFFAHGYECLSKTCIVHYLIDEYRYKKNENGIFYKDNDLKIRWKSKKPIISNRDKNLESFRYFKKKHITL